ncbi:MAG: bifunctional methylenetetrahydrofolate dehydrogenase/methenyltetrahydrofolate cyclohydrolase FolD [Desulfovibrio sp.]|nr:bifunctional methylenetetrahydrofolate dehydrogenase/methenyltetrahydrofolate cyclohydrolase FolD [Desulfovibrio sp.]
MRIIDGKATAAAIREELAGQVAALAPAAGRKPGLAVILVGEDPASQTYVRNKQRACDEIGVASELLHLPPDTSQLRLLRCIDALNTREDVDGILLQLPLPRGLENLSCLERIRPDKDVDGFHPDNMGRLVSGLPGLRPCTPAGVMELLKRHAFFLEGKRAVVLGRSNIVGKPLAIMLGARTEYANATVTVCHSQSKNITEICQSADFLFAAMGQPGFIRGDMVKPGAVVIDVGISVTEQGLRGDCDFASVSRTASAITPVPGGVGPMTIAMLLRNTLEAYTKHLGRI